MVHIMTRDSWFFCVVCFTAISDVELCENCVNDIDASAGCKDGWYGVNCSLSCESTCSKKACAIDTGHCLACQDGRFGVNCEKTCPKCNSKCDEHGHCLTGCTDKHFYGTACNIECTSGITNCLTCIAPEDNPMCFNCTSAKFGQKCENDCPEHCELCTNLEHCTKCTDGYNGTTCNCTLSNCLECDMNGQCAICVSGKFGPLCDEPCPLGCDTTGHHICKKQTGACSGDCKDGFYGTFCNITCFNCGTNIGHQGCNKLSGKCYSCKDGYYGPDCNMTCGINCVPASGKDTCDRDTGKCVQCTNMWYGPTCDKICPTNCDSYCNKETGKCDVCKSGFYGQYCNESCPSGCGPEPGTTVTKIVCNIMNAECLHCKSGFYGVRCTKYCEGKCAYDGSAPACEKSNGRCKGCVNGYFGDFCMSECAHCDNKTCVQDTGQCVQGCDSGWYNSWCNGRCSSTCKEETCDEMSGLCLIGCINEYSGLFCKTREPVDDNRTHLVVIAVVVIGIMLLSLAAVVLVIRRYGRLKRKQKVRSGYSLATYGINVNEGCDVNDCVAVMDKDIQSPVNQIADLLDTHIAEVHDIDTDEIEAAVHSTELVVPSQNTLHKKNQNIVQFYF